jgi:very-short-patch-repair endonuclease
VRRDPSSGLRPPSPARGEGHHAQHAAAENVKSAETTKVFLNAATRPSPLAGEGGRRPDEGSSPLLRDRARGLRRDMTEAERALWYLLRSRRFSGFKFRRQMPIGHYIADFVCLECRLIVEADGGQHAESTYDERRDRWLKDQGFRVLRFWNFDILRKRDEVAETLWHHLNDLVDGETK